MTVFRAPERWTVLTVSRLERYDEEGELRSAEAWVSATELADIEDEASSEQARRYAAGP